MFLHFRCNYTKINIYICCIKFLIRRDTFRNADFLMEAAFYESVDVYIDLTIDVLV